MTPRGHSATPVPTACTEMTHRSAAGFLRSTTCTPKRPCAAADVSPLSSWTNSRSWHPNSHASGGSRRRQAVSRFHAQPSGWQPKGPAGGDRACPTRSQGLATGQGARHPQARQALLPRGVGLLQLLARWLRGCGRRARAHAHPGSPRRALQGVAKADAVGARRRNLGIQRRGVLRRGTRPRHQLRPERVPRDKLNNAFLTDVLATARRD